ncbi:MAG: metal ABC transporter permease, partial [Candidatus Zixiibacteriota bacterium]
MSDYVAFLLWPFLACVVLTGIHVYFGLHILRRGIIFVDLALAQIAALGMTLAFLLEREIDDPLTYIFSLGLALLGGAFFAVTRKIEKRIPQEAIIGIVYAVSSAAALLAVSHSPEGAEHIRFMLVGSILTVTPGVVLKTALLFALVGLFHWLARSSFLSLSFSENGKRASRLWDFLFYASFAVVVTSAVKICGALLVFMFLVAPAVFSVLITEGFARRLVFGWVFGIVGSLLGLGLSFWLDTPTG